MSNKVEVKSRVSPARVITGITIAAIDTGLTGMTAWGVIAENWEKIYFDLTLMSCVLAWIATIAIVHARHVTRHMSRCQARTTKRINTLERSLKYGMVVAEAEQHLRAHGEG